jgi:hypothetical protein
MVGYDYIFPTYAALLSSNQVTIDMLMDNKYSYGYMMILYDIIATDNYNQNVLRENQNV